MKGTASSILVHLCHRHSTQHSLSFDLKTMKNEASAEYVSITSKTNSSYASIRLSLKGIDTLLGFAQAVSSRINRTWQCCTAT
eukprot:5765621-Pleurochrysis_carterae.AAC.2